MDRVPIRDRHCEAAAHHHHAEGHDEWRKTSEGDANAVDRTQDAPDAKAGEDDERHRHADIEQERRNDSRDGDDRTDRQIDAGGQDDESHAYGDDSE